MLVMEATVDNVPRASGVYAIRHKESGKVYVGSARSFASRWRGHQRLLAAKRHTSIKLQRAWDKYGSSAFEFVVLEQCALIDLITTEQRWLDLSKAATKAGYNISPTAGSIFGTRRGKASKARSAAALTRHYSNPEIRRRQSEAIGLAWRDQEYRQTHLAAAKERASTPEGRAQIKAARANRKDYSTFGAYARSFVKKPRNQYPEWTESDDKVLTELYGPEGAQAVAIALNRSLQSIYVRASRLGLKKGSGATEQYRQASLTREARKRKGGTQ